MEKTERILFRRLARNAAIIVIAGVFMTAAGVDQSFTVYAVTLFLTAFLIPPVIGNSVISVRQKILIVALLCFCGFILLKMWSWDSRGCRNYFVFTAVILAGSAGKAWFMRIKNGKPENLA